MAQGKHLRQEKRMPSFYVMITAVVIGAFCFFGIWVFRPPYESRAAEESEAATADVKVRSEEKTVHDSPASEDTSGNFQRENEETQEEKPETLSDLKSELDTELKDEEAQEEKPETLSDLKSELEIQHKDEEALLEEANKKPVSEQNIDETVTDEDSDDRLKEEDLGQVQKDSEFVKEMSQKDPELEENGGAQAEIQIENKENTGNWATQASESKEENEKVELEEKQKTGDEFSEDELTSDENPEDKKVLQQTRGVSRTHEGKESENERDLHNKWALCEFDGAIDYIPCLDNKEAIRALPSSSHYEHRERHCPDPAPTCLVPLPEGYRSPIGWPQSRQEVWYNNVPHPGLVSYKKDQNWVKKSGDRFLFPGGGTQFKHGALHYIDFIDQTVPDIAWGNHTRVILDVGCGVASFGGYMFDRNMLTMSFAPKDEHEAQVQLALERGIPAISSVMGTQRLVFPSNVYDAVHCARCRVPWHIEGGKLLLELNRVLRPGGYFVWSATPVYWKNADDVSIWKAMVELTAAICWELLVKTRDPSTGVGVAIFHKPTTNFCYENRKENFPPMCDEGDKQDAAWYVPMTACIHKIPYDEGAHGAKWPQEWPVRLTTAPTWLNSEKGLYGKQAAADFRSDTEHWQHVVEKSYLHDFGIDWKNIRNVMDMKAVYGGFAAALVSQSVWAMNVVQFDAADTLPIIFDRGLFGIYHDWCESFSSYPRTYDLLHADHLFSKLKKRCNITSTIVEMDRLLRPEGWAIFRDKIDVSEEIQSLLESLHWDVGGTYSKADEALLVVQKTRWRPKATS